MPFFVLRTARRSGLVAFGFIARITYPETLPRAGLKQKKSIAVGQYSFFYFILPLIRASS